VPQPSEVPGHALLVPGASIDSRDGYKTLAGPIRPGKKGEMTKLPPELMNTTYCRSLATDAFSHIVITAPTNCSAAAVAR
jgi:hypothetical protein